MNPDFFSLKVAEVLPEIKGKATSVTFDLPANLAEAFRWQAGQHVTLRFHLNGKEQRRSYTISNPPGAPLRVTVKRVTKGLISNHIGDHLKPGDLVDLMPPFGQFSLKAGSVEQTNTLFLWRRQWHHAFVCNDQCRAYRRTSFSGPFDLWQRRWWQHHFS